LLELRLNSQRLGWCPARLGFAVRSLCHGFFSWLRPPLAGEVCTRNPLQLHPRLIDADALAGVRQHVEAVAVAAVHGVVDGVHAIERGRNARYPHFVAKGERPAPGPQQIARQRQPACVAAVAPRDARIVGCEEGFAIGLAHYGPVGGGCYRVYRTGFVGFAASGRVSRRTQQYDK